MSSLYDYEWDEEPTKFLENAFAHYMDYLHDIAWGEADDDKTESTEPFCGCETCYSRETLSFLVPRIIDLYEAGAIRRISLQHVNKGEADDVSEVQDGRGKES